MNHGHGGGRGRGPGPVRRRPAPVSSGGYPAIGQMQFSFYQLVRQAIDNRKSVVVEFMDGESLEVVLLREDQFTFTVLVQSDLRIFYKHAIKSLAFTKP